MRTGLWVSLMILAAVIAAGTVSTELMMDLSDRYVAASEELRTLIESGDWTRAAETAGAYHQRWDETLRWLQMLMDHAEGDDVSHAFLQVEAGIRSRSLALCLLGCSELKEAALHLYHRDAFTPENVL